MDAAPGEWGDLDVEDVGEGPLVLRLPRGLDVADETRVERVGDEVPLGVVLGLALVEDDEIVDVDTDDELVVSSEAMR